MSCNPLDTANPYLWVFAAGIFMGLGMGCLPFRFNIGKSARLSSERRWTVSILFFSLAVLLFSSGLYAPRGGLFSGNPVSLDFLSRPSWLILFFAALLPGWASFRFPRAAGIPLFLILAALGTGSSLALRSWTCGPADREILTQTVLLERENSGTSGWRSVVQFDFADGRSLMATLAGRGIVPVVEILTPPRVLFFLGGETLFRITRVHGSDISPAASRPGEDGGELILDMPSRRFSAWGDVLTELAGIFPVMNYRRVIPEGPPPGPGQKVKILLDREAGALLQPVYF